ncbi:MAG TPA: Ig domain-containing protein [Candidatus Paceibacterota bacterium]|nr:Ig domain-containing protein [Verrucomicrobiota bacterium]HRZ45273.1 Ig domain-containing protein [Candidatus Paceibacterota bacterium]HRZ99282.1 Ig domain-containing protein [Candidatus Paceibacterota bacterium]
MASENHLVQGWGKGGMVTPLVDVVFNLMITMFIFLMIYMAVVIPRPKRPLHFADRRLPGGAPYQEYAAQIRVLNGSGNFTFYIGLTNLAASQGTIHVNETNGLVRGVFLETVPPRTRPQVVSLGATIVDNRMPVTVPRQWATSWTNGRTNLNLFFHEEVPPETRERLTADSRERTSTEFTNTVLCHYAIRGKLDIQIQPARAPFDPSQNPLRLTGPGAAKGIVGVPLEIPLGPLGGLEPYEFRAQGLPPWLTVDARRAVLTGTPAQTGRVQIALSAKDAQTPVNDWAAASRLAASPGHPLVSSILTLEIEEFRPLGMSCALPRFGRIGQPFGGAVLARGGVGRRAFIAQELPPGLRLDPDSGEISGTPTSTTTNALLIRVVDERTNSTSIRMGKPHWHGIIEAAPKPAIIRPP